METPFASTDSPIRLVSDDLGFNDEFGEAVSVSTTKLGSVRVTNVVVGASSDDDFGSKSGSIYIFSKFDDMPPETACGGNVEIEVGKWVQCRKLLPDDGATNDLFGKSVQISGRTIVTGAMWKDDRGIDSGAAYVFSLGDSGVWGFQQKLSPIYFDTAKSQANRFGVSVATSGDKVVVGADLDDYQGNDSGAAYVFRLSNGVWTLESELPQFKGAEDRRGYSCGSCTGDKRLSVGYPLD